jgi:hypothetical protein
LRAVEVSVHQIAVLPHAGGDLLASRETLVEALHSLQHFCPKPASRSRCEDIVSSVCAEWTGVVQHGGFVKCDALLISLSQCGVHVPGERWQHIVAKTFRAISSAAAAAASAAAPKSLVQHSGTGTGAAGSSDPDTELSLAAKEAADKKYLRLPVEAEYFNMSKETLVQLLLHRVDMVKHLRQQRRQSRQDSTDLRAASREGLGLGVAGVPGLVAFSQPEPEEPCLPLPLAAAGLSAALALPSCALLRHLALLAALVLLCLALPCLQTWP